MRVVSLSVCAVLCCGISSCEKAKNLVSDAKGWFSDDEEAESEATVDSVGKKQGEEIIASESRPVLVEFYSDT